MPELQKGARGPIEASALLLPNPGTGLLDRVFTAEEVETYCRPVHEPSLSVLVATCPVWPFSDTRSEWTQSRYHDHSLASQYQQVTIRERSGTMALAAKPISLMPQTLEAFTVYIGGAEVAMDQTLPGPFLWSDLDGQRTHQLQEGKVIAQFWTGRAPVQVPDGLIHDWIGAAFIPGTSVEQTLALIQDYDNHKNIYVPEVIASKLISQDGNDFQVYLRLMKKKIITVVLDTDHEVQYQSLGPGRWTCRSHTTRIAEVQDAGKPKETVLPPDTGYGFLWRLYSYWRFQERDAGVYVECRAISLTRDVPSTLRWAINPIINKLPKESLTNTLVATRQALHARAK